MPLKDINRKATKTVTWGHSMSNQPIFRKFQKLMSQNLLKF